MKEFFTTRGVLPDSRAPRMTRPFRYPISPNVFTVAEPRLPSVPEEDAVRLWLKEAVPGRTFVTKDGTKVRIVTTGTRNPTDGPDFFGCAIDVGGRTESGAVEVHVMESDWESHGHASSSRYDDVLLHVALFASERQSAPHGAYTVILSHQLLRPFRSEWPGVFPHLRSKPPWCADTLHHVPKAMREFAVTLLCEERFRMKCDRIRKRLDVSRDEKQVLFECLARALGFGGNEEALESFAVEHHYTVVDGSGLDELLRSGKKAVRPNNRIEKRLHQLAAFAAAIADDRWWNAMTEALCASDNTRPHAYTLVQSLLIRGKNAPGLERRKEILINVIAPFAYVEAIRSGKRSLARAARTLYGGISPAPQNSITRLIAPAFGFSGPMTSERQQGIIQLYKTLCAEHRCASCLIHHSLV